MFTCPIRPQATRVNTRILRRRASRRQRAGFLMFELSSGASSTPPPSGLRISVWAGLQDYGEHAAKGAPAPQSHAQLLPPTGLWKPTPGLQRVLIQADTRSPWTDCCRYAEINMCIYIYTHTHTRAPIESTRLCIYNTYIHTCICTCVCTYMYVYMFMYMHTCICAHVNCKFKM